MANRLYTSKDMKNASNVGKRSVSFQFIEGRGPISVMDADVNFTVGYLASLIGEIMSKAKFEGKPEDMAENIKNIILDHYKIKKES